MYLPTCVRLSGGRSALRPILRNPEVDRSPAEPFYPSGSKAGVEHRVPLPLEAVKLLKKLPRLTGTELLFPGTKGQALPDMIMTVVMRRMKADAVPHGFRSTFRDWAGEKTNFPRELAEQALAHTLQNKVEAAYRRGDALEKRRQMMQEWAHFVLPH